MAIENFGAMIDIRRPPAALSAAGFGGAWFALCLGLAGEIVEETRSGFLGIYNPTVTILRERWGWFPTPPLEFREWLLGLVAACGLLFFLTPVAARGMRGLRPWAWGFAIAMLVNSAGQALFTILGRTVEEVRFARPAPGFYASPFLFLAAIWMMWRLRRTARVDFRLPNGD